MIWKFITVQQEFWVEFVQAKGFPLLSFSQFNSYFLYRKWLRVDCVVLRSCS